MTDKKITAAMRQVLENIVAQRNPTSGFAGGRSTAGGLNGTFAGLFRRGLLTRTKEGHLRITDAGKEALNASRTH